MRILHLVQKPQRRGAEVFAYDLSQQLKQDGHAVSITYLYAGDGNSSLPIGNTDKALGASSRHFSERTIAWNPKLFHDLSVVVKEFQPDIIQSNGARTVKYGALLRLFHPADPWALIYRSIGDPKVWLKGWLKRCFYRSVVIPRFDGIVAVSRTTLDGLKSFYKKMPPSICIPRAIHQANLIVDRSREEMRAFMRTPEKAPVLVFLGSLSREKRVDRNIAAMERLKTTFPDLYLWIIGDGTERGALEKQTIDLGIQGRVRFAGETTRVSDFLAASDGLLLLSDTEGIPGVVLEAGALGIPSIVSRVGGAPECVKDGETGILVDPNNESEILSNIKILLTNSHLREKMGMEARRFVLETFAMDKISGQYIHFYDMVLRSKRSQVKFSSEP